MTASEKDVVVPSNGAHVPTFPPSHVPTSAVPTPGPLAPRSLEPFFFLRRHVLLLALLVLAAGLGVLWTWQANQALIGEVAARRARAAAVAADARRILQLRQRPKQAAEASLPQADLLTQVSAALQAAGIEPARLVSTQPQPPRKLPQSDHAELTLRLVLEGVPLEGLAKFCRTLTAMRPELRISGLQLRSAPAATLWNAEIGVAYWVLAPQRH